VLVAGIGNVFLGDDGFGVEVVRRLAGGPLPEGVDVVDYGIRGVHLAYDLLDRGYATLVLVDALPLAEPPGTLAVVEVPPDAPAACPVDGHAMSPDVVLAALRGLGGEPPRVLVVGCRPAVLDEGMQLSPVVAGAVDEAVRLVARVAAGAAEQAAAGTASGRERV
jgi:hydrogenase maturation protease